MIYHLVQMLQEAAGPLRVFTYVNFRVAMAVFSALLISILLGPWLVKKLQNLEIGQHIREDGPKSHQKKAGTPTMGGLLILAAIMIPTLLWADLTNVFTWILIGSTAAFGGIGFLDDFLKLKRGKNKGLGARQKMALQVVVALAVGLVLFSLSPEQKGEEYQWGDYSTKLTIPFIKQMDVEKVENSEKRVVTVDFFPDLGWLFIPFVMIVLIGSSNAVNLTDGLDGLAIGATGIAATSYTILAYLVGNAAIATYLLVPFVRGADEVSIFGGAIIGASIGFLWWNCFPASVFMGDVGSLALGGAIGTMAVIIKQELLLAIIGFLFVMEAGSVMLQVAYYKMTKDDTGKGRRLFRMAPLHHHFELKGWSEPKVITRFLILAIIFAMIGLSTLKLR